MGGGVSGEIKDEADKAEKIMCQLMLTGGMWLPRVMCTVEGARG